MTLKDRKSDNGAMKASALCATLWQVVRMDCRCRLVCVLQFIALLDCFRTGIFRVRVAERDAQVVVHQFFAFSPGHLLESHGNRPPLWRHCASGEEPAGHRPAVQPNVAVIDWA